MEIHFPPDLQEKLERAATQDGRGTDEYVQQLVAHYLDYDAWFRQKIKMSLERLDRGESVTHEEVGASIEDMLNR
jgi:predicted transcriptional regulator